MSHPIIAVSIKTPAGVPEVTVQQVHDLHAGARLVDVRDLSEFTGELGHVPGSELVPLGALEHAAATWDKAQPLILICRSGNRSGRATLALQRLGFAEVVNMKGGMLAYNAAGLPVEGKNAR